MKHLADFLAKTLTSRKFWAALTAAIPFALAHDWTSFAYVWSGYAGIVGLVDASERVGSAKHTAALPETADVLLPDAEGTDQE